LEREPRRVGVNRRDRAGMTGVDISDVGEGRSVPQLLEEDAVRPHAQAAFEEIFGVNLRLALPALRVEQPDVIGLRDDELRRILDGHDPLLVRDLVRRQCLDEPGNAARLFGRELICLDLGKEFMVSITLKAGLNVVATVATLFQGYLITLICTCLL